MTDERKTCTQCGKEKHLHEFFCGFTCETHIEYCKAFRTDSLCEEKRINCYRIIYPDLRRSNRRTYTF